MSTPPDKSTRSSRGNPAMGDVLRSVAVIGVILLAVWGFGQLFTNTPERTVPEIDYASTAASARGAVDYELLAPASLPDGWIANGARLDSGPTQAWHLGVLTPDDEYIGLEQLKLDEGRAIDRFAEGSKSAGSVEVGGSSWSLRTGPKQDDLTFSRSEGGVTILVTGNASRAAMERYISSLSSS